MLNYICKLFIIYLAIFSFNVIAKSTHIIKVAIIDTGIDPKNTQAPVCPGLSYNFVTNSRTLVDTNGHGSHVSDLIDQYAKDRPRMQNGKVYTGSIKFLNKNIKYCQIALRYYDDKAHGDENTLREIRALKYAKDVKADIVNLSEGGQDFDISEHSAVIALLNNGITVVAAAGNNHSDLAILPFFPALHDSRVIVVGSVDKHNKPLWFSNYGSAVDIWEQGLNRFARLPGKNNYGYMSGTSMSTAITTGKLIRKMMNQ